MKLSELQFELPEELIAQRPVEPRDSSRLLVVDRGRVQWEHRRFTDVREYLRPGDCLVLNDTRVLPARFFSRRATGGKIECLYLHESEGVWRLLLSPSARLKVGERLKCEGADQEIQLLARRERGEWDVRPTPEIAPIDLLKQVGQTPLPPYIRREDKPDETDERRYQTVYARSPGAAAAPTAGLHFTEELLESLRGAGVKTANVTLHVGLGTFAPICVEDLSKHKMHAEYYEIGADTINALNTARSSGGRIIAVGTTSVRVLETLGEGLGEFEAVDARSGWTNIFIYPPYEYRNVDGLLTNFHLPGSTLIAMLMAFGGTSLIRRAYSEAISSRYRFYSYGDAMFVH